MHAASGHLWVWIHPKEVRVCGSPAVDTLTPGEIASRGSLASDDVVRDRLAEKRGKSERGLVHWLRIGRMCGGTFSCRSSRLPATACNSFCFWGQSNRHSKEGFLA